MSYTLLLPYPVSTNRYLRNFRGRPIVSKEALAYKVAIALIATEQGVQPLDGDVALDLILHAKKTKKDTGKRARVMDLSNSLKISEDALIGIAFHDDAQTRAISMRYRVPVPGGALVITVSQISVDLAIPIS